MTREEKLCRRLCRYLDLEISVQPDGRIMLMRNGYGFIHARDDWNCLLFGQPPGCCGMCSISKWSLDQPYLADIELKRFDFSSLDELELKLAVRGF